MGSILLWNTEHREQLSHLGEHFLCFGVQLLYYWEDFFIAGNILRWTTENIFCTSETNFCTSENIFRITGNNLELWGTSSFDSWKQLLHFGEQLLNFGEQLLFYKATFSVMGNILQSRTASNFCVSESSCFTAGKNFVLWGTSSVGLQRTTFALRRTTFAFRKTFVVLRGRQRTFFALRRIIFV